MASKMSPVAESPGLDAGVAGMDRSFHHAADAGNQTGTIPDRHDAGGSTHHIDHVADADAGADGVPVGVKGSCGNRDSGAQAQPRGPLLAEVSGDLIAGGVTPAKLRADAGQRGIESGQEVFRRQPAESLVPHPLVAHCADAARYLGRVGDAAEYGGHHVAMFQRRGEARALLGIVAQPVEQFGEAPFAGIDAAAPVDRIQMAGVRSGGDLGGFLPGAVIAPQVVIVDGLEVGVHRDHAGACGIECDRLDGGSVDARVFDGAPRGGGQRGHVVGVTLRGVVRVFLLAMQRVRSGAGAQTPFDGIEDGNANAEGAEIYSGDDAHGNSCESTISHR